MNGIMMSERTVHMAYRDLIPDLHFVGFWYRGVGYGWLNAQDASETRRETLGAVAGIMFDPAGDLLVVVLDDQTITVQL